MKLLFAFDTKKCSACGACAIACMDQNDVAVEEGQQPYRKVFLWEKDGEHTYLSIACLHCPDAPCVPACPMGCLSKDAVTGLTHLDNRNCIGCHACARACPYDAPTFRPGGNREKMEKCHGCLVRIEAGLDPACVRACPTGALTWRWAGDDEVSSAAALWKEFKE